MISVILIMYLTGCMEKRITFKYGTISSKEKNTKVFFFLNNKIGS